MAPIVHEYQGAFAPSALATELRAAGFDVLGVTATDDPKTGETVAVQVIFGEAVQDSAVRAIVTAHNPNAATLAAARSNTATAIHAALDASDIWAARHAEDGISLTPARIAYRQELRTLLDSVATSADPGSIVIPDPPPAPKP